MNKQSSPIFFLVILVFFIFVFFSSANAVPKRIDKRACEQITRSCIFVPVKGNPKNQTEGRIDFQQQVSCNVIVQGLLSTVHHPNATGYDTLLAHYDVHITTIPDAAEPSFLDLEDFITTPSDPDRINEPFSITLPGNKFRADFFTTANKYYIVVAFEPQGEGTVDMILGSCLVIDPNHP
ncbi:733_t:CDS:1 [Ambispora gerdemannii]|uniref:733_t:CDS:1 n=1 Tax=Ambispora gerdemannii TaxID=144530 RepID=A0A9N9BIP9_9GLOM|nr:733_t:CDS:1 [Ambispora gerdemannii]